MRKTIPFILTIIMMALPSLALANNQAKVALAKQAIKSGKISPYASPSLKKILKRADAIRFQIEDAGCDLAEHYYLGHGQDVPEITNLKVTVLSNGKTRATFKNYGYNEKVDFSMSCQGNKCMIEDVNGTRNGIRADAQYIINHHDCPSF